MRQFVCLAILLALAACVPGGSESPASTPTPLFTGDNQLSGFEFCCRGYNTLAQFGFTEIKGDFIGLNGGHFATGIKGAVGERVFASFGDGYTDASDSIATPLGPVALGSALSPTFVIEADHINFLIGGGNNVYNSERATCVTLVVNGQTVRATSGNNIHNTLRAATWDVSAWRGQSAAIQFIDQHDGAADRALAYVMADDFRQSDTAVAPAQTTLMEEDASDSGNPLFTGVGSDSADIADFEFCCQSDAYTAVGFDVSGGFARLTGGLRADGIGGTHNERLFASYASGPQDLSADASEEPQSFGEALTGSMSSPTFTITKPYINFLVGGGSGVWGTAGATYVALQVKGEIERATSGRNEANTVEAATWDVNEFIGSVARVVIVDENGGSDGSGRLAYILADDFRADDRAVAPAQTQRLDPAQTGVPLFTSPIPGQGNIRIAGFEFKSDNNNAFAEYGFSFDDNDLPTEPKGGFPALGIIGAVGSYIFASNETGSVGEGAKSLLLGHEARVQMLSPTFVIDAPYINFLVGGGSIAFGGINFTAVVLRVDATGGNNFTSKESAVRATSGNDIPNTLTAATWDVTEFRGQTAVIQFIDDHDNSSTNGELAYLLADEFLASDYPVARPQTELPPTPPDQSINKPLFRSAIPGQQDLNIAGFEFCCRRYNTYIEHGFSEATGDLAKLDGGFYATGSSPIRGALGERVFSSYGDGAPDEATVPAQLGERATGTITSPSFTIDTPYINFLVGGGSNLYGGANTTAVVLIVDDNIVRASSGNDQHNALARATWDVSAYDGKSATIRFIDNHNGTAGTGTLAYILADDFRASSTAAVTAQTALPPAPTSTRGQPLFASDVAGLENLDIAGFEFCCRRFNTYGEHGFGVATGDLGQLDGGHFASEITGAVGERVFASYGDGSPNDDTAPVQLGPEATGTLNTPEFTISARYINFLVGGGSNTYSDNNTTAVTLRVKGIVVRTSSGDNTPNTLQPATWDVAEFNGMRATIQFIDQHDNTTPSNPNPSNPNPNSVVGGTATANTPVLAYIIADDFRAADVPATTAQTTSPALPPPPTPVDKPLFASTLAGQGDMNVAGFEFCCRRYNTYIEHGFSAVSGDFAQLDGGFFAIGSIRIAGAVGERVFSSYGDGSADEATAPTQLGPEATGTLTSPVFTIDTPYINFLVGGGSSPYDSSYPTAVVLNINGAIVRAASGSDSAVSLTPVTWDVSQYQGQTATVEFIDRDDNVRGTGTLAYILADEFRAADIATTTAQTALPPPWTAGRPLYASAVPGLENMNVAGFELCCRNYNTYGEHGFSAATGDFAQFNGGHFASEITGAVGERVFASYGDGSPDDNTAPAQLGPQAVGTIDSPAFSLSSRYINFLIGGGSSLYGTTTATAVALIIDGRAVRAASGTDVHNVLAPISWDVSEYTGMRATLRFIDQNNTPNSETNPTEGANPASPAANPAEGASSDTNPAEGDNPASSDTNSAEGANPTASSTPADGASLAGVDTVATLAYILADEFRADDVPSATMDTLAPQLSALSVEVAPGGSIRVGFNSNEAVFVSLLALPVAQALFNPVALDIIAHNNTVRQTHTDTASAAQISISEVTASTEYTVYAVITDYSGNHSAIQTSTISTPAQ